MLLNLEKGCCWYSSADFVCVNYALSELRFVRDLNKHLAGSYIWLTLNALGSRHARDFTRRVCNRACGGCCCWQDVFLLLQRDLTQRIARNPTLIESLVFVQIRLLTERPDGHCPDHLCVFRPTGREKTERRYFGFCWLLRSGGWCSCCLRFKERAAFYVRQDAFPQGICSGTLFHKKGCLNT